MKHPFTYYFVNAISAYRLAAFLLLVFLLYQDNLSVFRWVLALSFFTDLIDGFLARKLKVQSAFGARLDSVADDFTVLAGLLGMYFFKKEFLEEQAWWLVVVLGLFLLQTILAFIRYGKTTSFHTYLAKAAAIFQGSFMILLFFLDEAPYALFYAAAGITGIELLEEVIITLILPEWKTDVRGLYWVIGSLRK